MPGGDTPEIPDRLYFRIGDVSDLAGVEPYVLRFWETEFRMLQPKKGKSGQREYRRKDVELILEIKRLLYDEGFTIPGARKTLQEKVRGGPKKPEESRSPSGPSAGRSTVALNHIRKELQEILKVLKKHP